MKTIAEINERIAGGRAVVLTAEEVKAMARESGPAEVARKVDVVATATFGAMCSSGCFINFGHPEPSIRMESLSLGGVPLFGGVAAVDAYIGATEASPEDPRYGGAHVIEALLRGEDLQLRAHGKGTDCYPRREISTWVNRSTVNEIVMVNPRNAYQNYPAATNSSERTIYTYMGNLLPRMGNVNYSTSGELSPLLNDPELRTIGIGTPIFLGGARGYVSWNGTQFNTERAKNARGIPELNARTLMVTGDLKCMDPRFIRAAYYEKYGTTLYVGIGVAIPVLDADMAMRLSVTNADIDTTVCDYGADGHPALRKVSYAELRSGEVELRGRKVKTASLSSLARAREIAGLLKERVASGAFPLAERVAELPARSTVRGLALRERGE